MNTTPTREEIDTACRALMGTGDTDSIRELSQQQGDEEALGHDETAYRIFEDKVSRFLAWFAFGLTVGVVLVQVWMHYHP